MSEITDPEELRELLGAVNPRAAAKERVQLHPRDREWIAASPFVVLATSDAAGNCDASPKGDPAGFVRVLDDRTIAIPERPGNRRADGYLNILDNPHIGVLFVIPGRTETLRVNGRARLVRDAPYFDDMIVRGHRPILAVEVDIDQIFFHCGKAFLRSNLWHPDRWPADTLPTQAHLVKELQPDTPQSLEELTHYYSEPNYAQSLYKS
ncbi:pyridoxamine 5'-phosphate oxidase family protein [Nocardia otitidiscaviarum]|uniref:Pyridoxamine 5'-phosphate oxidase family protein n=1 Tax=Nocardia otitidiscaviarum TaxID=1823 RepID=A0A378YDH6_9NOCA|nr:pyridoxamine 5'-phosphate oxidase family protein [Nocardia otitidiscaviarum]MBF6136144.1 pyridoxamine 5'-phosphate oxidase family protein [Nocardia otitidiscaviarum]MBF6179001.1 pyridoxamine 5'-phosphate oxidase family protein [Nocardia otitidiscaviarum]MBF6483926.1 pyridoxamine 5'-phosphate oxidase family protein [Nocardia otitidiscaviarum]MCP9621713.1 pyridoxamine 5'-phosphate oxidase family protein [Nocardia otitidiscaviarum]QDP82348.1 pyridoxamine 5'-phosphate oxidase family protein [No